MAQLLIRKASFDELSPSDRRAYVLCVVFGVVSAIAGIVDVLGVLPPLPFPKADGSFVDVPLWLTSMISFVSSFICFFVMLGIIKYGSADRLQETIVELVEKGKVIIFPRRNTKR